jgi:hypothetical protein
MEENTKMLSFARVTATFKRRSPPSLLRGPKFIDTRLFFSGFAKQIEKKVYLYGFLKGEVEVSAQELAAELKETQKEIISLRKQLQSQQAAQVVNYGTININDNSKNIKF